MPILLQWLSANTFQALNGVRSESKKLEEQVKKLEGLLAESNVRVRLVRTLRYEYYCLSIYVPRPLILLWPACAFFRSVLGKSGEGRAEISGTTKKTHGGCHSNPVPILSYGFCDLYSLCCILSLCRSCFRRVIASCGSWPTR